ncbi:protein TonB-like isoform X1 [Chrysoperla carnea]|uniref:protein TonB-like isoform X1 n=1 Tax=Chrysoperla carnea TaxID=189513 RepID=UPI001D089B04|nr:protein TonB-like isoform X1 [Chrysoperla carnea]
MKLAIFVLSIFALACAVLGEETVPKPHPEPTPESTSKPTPKPTLKPTSKPTAKPTQPDQSYSELADESIKQLQKLVDYLEKNKDISCRFGKLVTAKHLIWKLKKFS